MNVDNKNLLPWNGEKEGENITRPSVKKKPFRVSNGDFLSETIKTFLFERPRYTDYDFFLKYILSLPRPR